MEQNTHITKLKYGDGGEYYKNNEWFKSGSTPKPNSIISWNFKNSDGKWHGHVAYVEGVTSDGIYISHAGSGETWYGVEKIGLDGYIWGHKPNGYIYLDEPI